MSDPDLSSDLFRRLNAGSESAAEEVDRHFRQKLCTLVEREMGKRFASREDPEDPVQSAMRSFYRGIDDQRFQIDSSGGLWRLLEKITRRKILKHVERHDALKCTPKREVPAEGQWFLAREPNPEDAVEVADLVEHVLEGLKDPYPDIFRLRFQGCTRAEIAKRLNCSNASVRFKLERIRDRFRRLLADRSVRGSVGKRDKPGNPPDETTT
jgi:RNA polymerase sigma factor (sigma-70 family)